MIHFASGISRNFTQPLVIGDKKFLCWVADNHTARTIGLMGCQLKTRQGCLLDFGDDADFGLWMKDCLHPLVAVFIDKEGKVIQSAHMDPKDSNVIHRASKPCRYALEILPEEAAGIKIGEQVYVEGE
jgi:uncharacterized membrane protein (UPF0127 family)